MNAVQRQVAANIILDKGNRLDYIYRLHRQPVNRIHHCHLLLLLSLKADTHFWDFAAI